MDTENTLTLTDNGFSWRRVGEVARFYYPLLRGQIIVYTLTSLFIAIMSLIPFGEVAQFGLFSLFWTALPLIFEVGPCIFARGGDTRIVERMIPARGSEKFTFIFLYLFVALPIMVFALPEVAIRLYMCIPSIETPQMVDLLTLRLDMTPTLVSVMNVAGSVAAAVTCLFVVYHSRTNRILKAVVAVFATKFAMAFFGAIWGFAFAFKKGFEDGVAGCPSPDGNGITQVVYSMMGDSPYLMAVTILIIAYCVVMLWLSYRAITRRNL